MVVNTILECKVIEVWEAEHFILNKMNNSFSPTSKTNNRVGCQRPIGAGAAQCSSSVAIDRLE